MTKANVKIPQDFDRTTHKQCSTCKQVLTRGHFANDRSKKDGKRSRCRGCQREWNKKHGDRRREIQRKYAAKPQNRFKKYKRSASERGFEWKLTFAQFMKYWKLPCVHCGDPIETIGLDRIDSGLPYRKDNVEPCCASHNRQKSDMTTKDWYASMDRVTFKRIRDNGGSEHLIGLLQDILNNTI